MLAVGDNNPRVFAETIGLDSWRTKFDGKKGEADLHIDVVFHESGRIGGENAPVRFRLSLKRAEIHVIEDSEDIIKIVPPSVLRAELPPAVTRKRVTERQAKLSGGLKGKVSGAGVNASAHAEAGGSMKITETIKSADNVSGMQVRHWPTKTGFAFKISARFGGRLDGQPWAATTVVMKLKDNNAKRTHGEQPEVRVEIHSRREDLVIEDVKFTDASLTIWEHLTRNKQIVVEQFIKEELSKAGLPCGDLSNAFTRIILADAMPSEVT